MSETVQFSYGALSDTLEEQANKQGFTLGDDSEMLEKIKNARMLLIFKDILTGSQAEQTAKKIQSKVVKALRPLEESNE